MANVNKKMLQVFRGFSNLEFEERVEVLKQINAYQTNIDHEKRTILLREFSARAGVDLGPTGQGACPCCGK